MSTMLLMGLTPAASRRAAIHWGAGPIVTSADAAAYRGQRPASSMVTFRRSAAPIGTGANAMVAPRAVEGSVSGRSYAVDTSRARPRTLRQSGRLAVTSKSITASPPPASSTDATSNPHRASFRATSSADSGTSTNSRSHDRTNRIAVYGTSRLSEPHDRTQRPLRPQRKDIMVFLAAFAAFAFQRRINTETAPETAGRSRRRAGCLRPDTAESPRV